MNIDACKTSGSYTNLLVNVIINNSKKSLLEQQYFPPLNNPPVKFHCHLINLSLLEIQVQEIAPSIF